VVVAIVRILQFEPRTAAGRLVRRENGESPLKTGPSILAIIDDREKRKVHEIRRSGRIYQELKTPPPQDLTES
jgi:hypothetical protein